MALRLWEGWKENIPDVGAGSFSRSSVSRSTERYSSRELGIRTEDLED